jgi:hypothetical protein
MTVERENAFRDEAAERAERREKAGRIITLHYPKRCSNCGELISRGQKARYFSASGKVQHLLKDCPRASRPPRNAAREDASS